MPHDRKPVEQRHLALARDPSHVVGTRPSAIIVSVRGLYCMFMRMTSAPPACTFSTPVCDASAEFLGIDDPRIASNVPVCHTTKFGFSSSSSSPAFAIWLRSGAACAGRDVDGKPGSPSSAPLRAAPDRHWPRRRGRAGRGRGTHHDDLHGRLLDALVTAALTRSQRLSPNSRDGGGTSQASDWAWVSGTNNRTPEPSRSAIAHAIASRQIGMSAVRLGTPRDLRSPCTTRAATPPQS